VIIPSVVIIYMYLHLFDMFVKIEFLDGLKFHMQKSDQVAKKILFNLIFKTQNSYNYVIENLNIPVDIN
jgi:hypothetical protein